MKIRIEVNSSASKNPSGVGYYTQRLTNALSRQPNTKVIAFFFNFLMRQPRPTLDSKVERTENIFFPLRIYAKLQSHNFALPFDILSKKVDLTIFPNYANWPHVSSKLSATTIHDLTYIQFPELMEKNNLPHLTRVVQRSIQESDFIITVSQSVKKELEAHFSLSQKPIIITPVPPDEKFFKRNNNEVHRKYKIPTDKYIFFISTIEPRKNIPLLIAAYEALPKEIQSTYSLVLSGGMGWKSEESQNAIKSAQNKHLNVIHTGYIEEEDKPALYQKASLFVMPSIYEGFGMPLLEAAASKTPVVATDIPVFRESISNGATYFKNNNKASLVNAIVSVLINDKLRKERIVAASKKLEEYSWEKNAKLIIETAEKLLHP